MLRALNKQISHLVNLDKKGGTALQCRLFLFLRNGNEKQISGYFKHTETPLDLDDRIDDA
jgi:hypothetical protein